MSTDAGGVSASNDGLGPLLVEADMDALAAVAHQAGLTGIDLHALARVLDAAQKIAVAAERDCRTCKNWAPHHYSDVMHCAAALRCVAGSSYVRSGVVQLWEAAPVDAGF